MRISYNQELRIMSSKIRARLRQVEVEVPNLGIIFKEIPKYTIIMIKYNNVIFIK